MAEAVLEAQAEEAKALVAEAPVTDAAAEDAAEAAPLIPEEAAVDAPVWLRPVSPLKKSWTMGTVVLTVVLGKLRWPT